MTIQTDHPPVESALDNPLLRRAFNVPNAITLSRLILAGVLFWMIDKAIYWQAATWLFVIAAATDFLDGYIARKYGLVTVLGRIMDPFVDKIIICGAFIFLMDHPNSGVGPWMVIAVIGREMFVTSLRSFLEQQGKDFSASLSGKLKMLLQCAAVTACLVTFAASTETQETLVPIRDVLLWSAVAVTVWSGAIYIVRAFQLLKGTKA
ncbi:MAG: CDP-diacylglycerol--glycerol-3-phosphate 3-phosphatidyltransferase [Planctomycetaceae bacterium]